MNIEQILNLINGLAFVLLAISPTVFVFAVTLLGSAIEKAQQEEKMARKNESEKIQEEILEADKSLQKAKKDGDTTELTKKIEQLKKSQINTNKKIKKIKIKYSRIEFKNTVMCPGLASIFVVIMSPLGSLFYDIYVPSFFPILFAQISLLSYSFSKIYSSLTLVQEINAEKKESESQDRLKETFKLALFEHNQSIKTKEEISIGFVGKKFPLNVAPLTELDIEFRVKLKEGLVLQDSSVWFFIPEGFDLIDPPESESWRQPSSYDLSNIRTVKISIGKLSIGPYLHGTLKIKTPADSGKYSIRYKAYADGYEGSARDITLLVGR